MLSTKKHKFIRIVIIFDFTNVKEKNIYSALQSDSIRHPREGGDLINFSFVKITEGLKILLDG